MSRMLHAAAALLALAFVPAAHAQKEREVAIGLQAAITSIDPSAKRVVTDAGEFEGDVMVVALGADLDPAATPGLQAGGYEFYSPEGADRARDAIMAFDEGAETLRHRCFAELPLR